ncbi:GNAT family N-acetyltransferase [Streptococcus halichoeri]|uniref:GNAT family N-acetyltransferase n=1 Tax=Streptococcus halichoeri TaxID=254785 RepID=UPI001356C8DA|nr:GNAT family N-acetyltransferase [Streptococcus halichoeri]
MTHSEKQRVIAEQLAAGQLKTVAAYQGKGIPQAILTQIRDVEWKAGAYLYQQIIEGELAATDYVITLTDAEQTLIGFASLLQEDIIEKPDFGPFLSTVYVAPSHRGQDLSRFLVEAILEAAKASGFTEIYTITAHQGLYEKSGFHFVREVTDRFGRSMRLLQLAL